MYRTPILVISGVLPVAPTLIYRLINILSIMDSFTRLTVTCEKYWAYTNEQCCSLAASRDLGVEQNMCVQINHQNLLPSRQPPAI
ncbi:hypothetical protein GDO81_017550 [Engystomops pustulosus]|uniref:Secreted protein n=1 Tax=Engystomops pustulosus TaxID=76066 RepID=A0AAV7A2R0_ENGPU|nr:hypothetical protein GDO81_017550 [Engystomops pustulosus]